MKKLILKAKDSSLYRLFGSKSNQMTALVNELQFKNFFKPEGESERRGEVDPLTLAAIYLTTGRVSEAENILSMGLADENKAFLFDWVPGGIEYAKEILLRIRDLPEFKDRIDKYKVADPSRI